MIAIYSSLKVNLSSGVDMKNVDMWMCMKAGQLRR
jgi:hypothetical protein